MSFSAMEIEAETNWRILMEVAAEYIDVADADAGRRLDRTALSRRTKGGKQTHIVHSARALGAKREVLALGAPPTLPPPARCSFARGTKRLRMSSPPRPCATALCDYKPNSLEMAAEVRAGEPVELLHCEPHDSVALVRTTAGPAPRLLPAYVIGRGEVVAAEDRAEWERALGGSSLAPRVDRMALLDQIVMQPGTEDMNGSITFNVEGADGGEWTGARKRAQRQRRAAARQAEADEASSDDELPSEDEQPSEGEGMDETGSMAPSSPMSMSSPLASRQASSDSEDEVSGEQDAASIDSPGGMPPPASSGGSPFAAGDFLDLFSDEDEAGPPAAPAPAATSTPPTQHTRGSGGWIIGGAAGDIEATVQARTNTNAPRHPLLWHPLPSPPSGPNWGVHSPRASRCAAGGRRCWRRNLFTRACSASAVQPVGPWQVRKRPHLPRAGISALPRLHLGSLSSTSRLPQLHLASISG